MAFGIASGVTPQAGIYTAIVGGLLVSLLGGSKIQIGGPTGAFVVIIAGIVSSYGITGLLMVTMMAGVMLLILGLTGLGSAVEFIPRPIVIGFTNGIALLIASTQIKDFFGLDLDEVPVEFLARMRVLATRTATLRVPTLALGASSLALLVALAKYFPRIPSAMVALAAGTAAVTAFHLPVETIGSKFGGIPSGFPSFSVPHFDLALVTVLFPSAVTVALLAALESLLSAVVADSMSGDRHRPNAELVAQGAANLVVPFFGGIPVTGAIARTATNFRSGAKTPVSGIIHTITLLGIIMVAAPLAKFVPLATLSAVLFVVAYRMGEWSEIPSILRLELAEKSVWLITFVLTLVTDLTVAVAVGMGLAALLYIQRVTSTSTVSIVTREYIEEGRVHSLQDQEIPPYVSILRIHGPFLFGTTSQLANETRDLERLASIVIVRLRNMTAIDATGIYALEAFGDRLKNSGRTLILCGARSQPRRFLERAEFVRHIGTENILPHLHAALERARQIFRSTATGDQPVGSAR
jgi:sulfate permease, SulP family